AEQVNVPGRRLGAFLETGMAERVHDDMVVWTNQALDHPEAGRPARREKRDMVVAEEVADLALERDRQGGVADQRRRAGAMDAEFTDRLERGGDDIGMIRQA